MNEKGKNEPKRKRREQMNEVRKNEQGKKRRTKKEKTNEP